MSEHVCDSLTDYLQKSQSVQEGELVTRAVVIWERMNTDGDRALSVAMSTGMAPWDAVGMLDAGNVFFAGLSGLDPDDEDDDD